MTQQLYKANLFQLIANLQCHNLCKDCYFTPHSFTEQQQIFWLLLCKTLYINDRIYFLEFSEVALSIINL